MPFGIINWMAWSCDDVKFRLRGFHGVAQVRATRWTRALFWLAFTSASLYDSHHTG
jgi:hypothetical protein